VNPAYIVGVISDTHGLLRPEALDVLRDSDLIVHAGDVGAPEVLERLDAVAPTMAVRGNVDIASWAEALPLTRIMDVGDVRLYVLHNLSTLDIEPKSAAISAVIFGHSHKPTADMRDGVLFLNPGSAGPKRFSLPVTVAKLRIGDKVLSHEFIQLRA
jgi:putative phosphoesterase